MAKISEAERLQIFKDLVAIKSVNTDEETVSEYLKDLLAKHGIEATIIPVSEHRTDLQPKLAAASRYWEFLGIWTWFPRGMNRSGPVIRLP